MLPWTNSPFPPRMVHTRQCVSCDVVNKYLWFGDIVQLVIASVCTADEKNSNGRKFDALFFIVEHNLCFTRKFRSTIY